MYSRVSRLGLCAVALCSVVLVVNLCFFNKSRTPIVAADNPVDFGNILQLGHKLHSIKLENRSREFIEITKLENSCGCTLSKIDHNIIAPGDTAVVTADLFSFRREGPFATKITVHWKTHDTHVEGQTDIVLKAVAVSLAIIDPMSLDITCLEPQDKSKTVSLRIRRGSSGQPWDELVAWDDNEKLPVTSVSKDEYAILYTFNAENKPIGSQRRTINIALKNHGVMVENPFQIPVNVKIAADVTANPGSIYIGMVASNSIRKGAFKIVSHGGYDMKLVSLESTNTANIDFHLAADKTTKSKDGEVELLVNYNFRCNNLMGNSSFKADINIQSNGKMYRLMIPVIVYAGSA